MRKVEDLSWKMALILIGCTLFFVGEPLLSGDIPVPLDEVARGDPWHGVTGIQDSLNPDANDTAKQMLPWMKAVRHEILAGRAPLWNQWSFSGYPLLGNGQSAPFFPPFLLTLWVPLPDQIVAMAGVKVFVGLLFGFLLLRREQMGEGAALFGSAVFAFSIFVTVYLYYPLGSTVLLVPLCAWAVLRCIDEVSWSRVTIVAIAVATLQTAGHPETVFHAAVVVVLLLGIEALAPLKGSRQGFAMSLLAACAGVTIGMLLSAPAWIPVLEQSLQSLRVADIDRGGFGGLRYPAGALWVLLNPNGYGHPVRETWSWIMTYPMVAPTYISLLALSMLPAALVARSSSARDRFLVIGGVLLTFMALHWTWFGSIFAEMFPWIAHDRLRFGAVLLFGMAASRQIDGLVTGKGWMSAASGAAATALVAGYVWFRLFGTTLEPRDAVGMIALAVFWAGFAWTRRTSKWPVAGWVGAVVVIVELTVFGTEYNPPVRRDLYAPPLPIVDALKRHAPEEPFRVVGVDWSFLPNASVQYGLEDVRGSDPMAWGPYTRFVEGFDVDDDATDIQRIAEMTAPELDFLNVRFALSEPGWKGADGWALIRRGTDGALWENLEVLPRVYIPSEVTFGDGAAVWGEVAAVEDFGQRVIVAGDRGGNVAQRSRTDLWIGQMNPTSYRIRVEPDEDQRLVATSLPAVRGWRVEVEGNETPVVTVNGAFIGFWMPANATAARIRYAPASWRWSLALAGLGCGLLVAGRRAGKAPFLKKNPAPLE